MIKPRADLRARADQLNAWLVSLENGPLDLHRVLDAQELIRDLLAVVDQRQTLLAKLEYMEPEKFAAWRARAETLRAEAAEAKVQALQQRVQVVEQAIRAQAATEQGSCEYGAEFVYKQLKGWADELATLTQPDAASPERG